MNFYVLIFDRQNPTSVEVREFADLGEAIERLREAEARRRAGEHDLEIVLLNATDEDDLRRTHARYFESIAQLLDPA